ncbi:hypothetical protein, partial [Rhizobium leguminosarum]|uniref:hypothetical protein n=2 Tax=Rhizobium leguminosarum TaxID=384 RepID=UPI00197E255A
MALTQQGCALLRTADRSVLKRRDFSDSLLALEVFISSACRYRKTWGNRGAITPGHIYKMMAGVVAPDKMEKRAHDWNRAQTSNG